MIVELTLVRGNKAEDDNLWLTALFISNDDPFFDDWLRNLVFDFLKSG